MQHKFNVLLIGYGGREHAIAWKLTQSPHLGRLYVAPGNAGTGQLATNVAIDYRDIDGLLNFVQTQAIDFTIVGFQRPLAQGIVDRFKAAGLLIFGSTQAASQLETSKAFSKAFMQRHGIPTPACAVFSEYDQALAYLHALPTERVVVKISGLGWRGQGVTVCDTRDQAVAALRSYMLDHAFGNAGAHVLIEERIYGPEISAFALSDGHTILPLPFARDHKRLLDGDRGPNTAGMGAVSPPPGLDETTYAEIVHTVLAPTVAGMAADGTPFVGVLYAGMMLTDDGVRCIEYNVRFGNPEAQAILPLVEGDLLLALLACAEGSLSAEMLTFSRTQQAATVALAAPGYPTHHGSGLPLRGLDAIADLDDTLVFHHSTCCNNGQLVTNQYGRAVTVTGIGETLEDALQRAYAGIEKVDLDNGHYRRDIGRQTTLSE